MNETKCSYVRNGMANFTIIRKNKNKELNFQQPLYQVRTVTCFVFLLSSESKGDAEIKSNHCMYYNFSSGLFTYTQKIVFNVKHK